MSDREEKIARIVELLLLWGTIRTMHWPAAKAALEERISLLSNEFFNHNGTPWEVLKAGAE